MAGESSFALSVREHAMYTVIIGPALSLTFVLLSQSGRKGHY